MNFTQNRKFYKIVCKKLLLPISLELSIDGIGGIMPFQSFHNSRSELTMSIVSDYDPDEDIMESPAMRRAMAIPCEV